MLVNLNSVLVKAKENRYGVGQFNVVNMEMARGVIAAAEKLQSPVILGVGERLLRCTSLEEMSYFLLPMAKKSNVPVVVHLDHAHEKDTCMAALELGFSSIMYDCSKDSLSENMRKMKEMADIAHAYGATIEGELGHVGDNEGSLEGNSYYEDPTMYFTDPQVAREFVHNTQVDALAVAVGTAHGAYKSRPKLDFNRIDVLARDVMVPLVLHGGSGLADSDFREAIYRGICKINIFTDINYAAAKGAYEEYKGDLSGLTEMIPGIVNAVKVESMMKMTLFESIHRI